MVFEVINIDWIERQPAFILLFGFMYAIIGYIIATIFFTSNVSVAMLFLTTLLVVPTLIRLIDIEEQQECIDGIAHFFHNHKKIIEAYLFLFIGVFFGYVILGFASHEFSSIFDFQLRVLQQQEGLNGQLIQSFLDKPLKISPLHVLSILRNNLLVSFICFMLSVFYGAGAVFLLIFNASVFASFVVYISQELVRFAQDWFVILGFFSIHLIPEVLGFLTAAIAGGVISKALLTEKPFTTGFRNVVKDAFILLLISSVFIILGSVLEVYVTTPLFYYYF